MIRTALQNLANNDRPEWLVRRIPAGVWNWAFEVTPNEAMMQDAYAALMARPNITVYDYDGRNRRPANPFAELRRGLAKTAEAAAAMAEHLNQMFAGFRRRVLIGFNDD
ncbi:hypothetical protein [Mycobacterium sp. 1465703.0]|uniref:hypothetical protein n=1 Tax=Mycobacterium sp. 1465703.0 TaxID=1834078 RepID=UPI0007FB9736|nr:hypothetical protein [Mycobacterium sp. 1465703.0]OBI95562.1 hypothetical protein A5625_08075 [Mycobacterium sp. 1465703.0]